MKVCDIMPKFCANCGQELKKNVKFCLNCGQNIYKDEKSDNNRLSNVNLNCKSKIVAGLLGIFLGNFGVHNFYLGYNKKGFIQLAITIFTGGILSVAIRVWGMVEGILILCDTINIDADGDPLR